MGMSISIKRTKDGENSKRPHSVINSGLFREVYKRPDIAWYYWAYERNSDVKACVRERAEGVAANGYRFYDRLNQDNELPDDVTEELESVVNPNKPLNSFRKIKKRFIRDLSICGNAYGFLRRNIENTRIIGIDPIHPVTMSIISDSHGNVIAYVQKSGQYSRVFDPSEIIHIKLGEDTTNELFGESPILGIDVDIRADVEASRTNLTHLENDAIPTSLYVLREDLTDPEQIQIAMDRIAEAFGGKNRGKSGVLPDVKDIKFFEKDFTKIALLDMRKFTTDKVCAAFGVPKFKIGYTESVNNNNGIELTKNFYNDTIRPLDDEIEEVYTLDFFPRIGGDRYGMIINPQILGSELEQRSLAEYERGALTLRQYKLKTGQKITDEDEENPNIDKHIIQKNSAVLVEQVGEIQEQSQNNQPKDDNSDQQEE